VKHAGLAGIALLAAACGAGRAPVQQPPAAKPEVHAAPEGTAHDIVRESCLTCHTEDLLKQQRLTPAQWTKTVDKMHGWGATAKPDEMEPLAAYLAATYGREAPAYVPLTLSAADAAARLSRLPDGAFAGGDAGRGKTLYTARCAPCHGEDGRGGQRGVAIAGRHVLDRAPDFAAVIRSGRARMPEYAQTTDAQIADLLAHVRSLPDR
jgi:mono/diheme cytochrome c family protein